MRTCPASLTYTHVVCGLSRACKRLAAAVTSWRVVAAHSASWRAVAASAAAAGQTCLQVRTAVCT